MKVTTYKVNGKGLAEIRSFLAENHKKGGDHFTDEMIKAWAADAEFQIAQGNQASIEIRSSDCIHGCTVEYRISGNGLDAQEVEVDD